MSYVPTVLKLYPPVTGSHPASSQLLGVWHLALPGVWYPYCEGICGCYFHVSVQGLYMHSHAGIQFVCQTDIDITTSKNVYTFCQLKANTLGLFLQQLCAIFVLCQNMFFFLYLRSFSLFLTPL